MRLTPLLGCLTWAFKFVNFFKSILRRWCASLTIKWGGQVRILTGDAPTVAVKVARDLGILRSKPTPVDHITIQMESPVNETDLMITGPQLAALSTDQDAFDKALERCLVFAKISPHQKLQVVKGLRKSGGGRAVAFLGDGVNDAMAIRAADVGISVDSGTEIAKEAADVILLEKSLDVIAHGILQGRMTYVLYSLFNGTDNNETVVSSIPLNTLRWPRHPTSVMCSPLSVNLLRLKSPFVEKNNEC